MGKPRKAPRAPKPTKIERLQRIELVKSKLMAGESRSQLMEYSSKTWGLERAATDMLISAANAMFREEREARKERDLEDILSKQETLYVTILGDRPTSESAQGSSVGLPNYGAARAVLMDRAKLLGLEKQKVEHTIDDKRELADRSDSDLDAIIAGRHDRSE